jgi:hypothetical protein
MRRYFFHLVTMSERSHDEYGTEFIDLASAKRQALRELGEVLADFPDASTQIEVTDSSGDLVYVTGVSSTDRAAMGAQRQ